MNLSISESKKLPVSVRKWYINKILRKIEKENKQVVKNQTYKKSEDAKPASEIDIGKVNKFFKKFEK